MKHVLLLTTNGDREIVGTRMFDAPRRLVYDAWTKPELIKRWLGARAGWTFDVCEVDLRVGGKYRWVWRREDTGYRMGMGGVYTEIAAPERLVSTEKFDDAWYPGEGVNTLLLAEDGARTKLTMIMRYDTKEARDGVFASPMESGLKEGLDKLDEVLATLG